MFLNGKVKKVAEVKNNKEGLNIILKIKEFYKSKGCVVRLRSRHSNIKRLYETLHKYYHSGFVNYVPLAFAERIAVYVYGNGNIPEFKIEIKDWEEEFKWDSK